MASSSISHRSSSRMRRAPNADPEDASFPSAQSARPFLAQLKPSWLIPRYLKSFRWIVITLTFILVSWITYTGLFSQPLNHILPGHHGSSTLTANELKALAVPQRSSKPSTSRRMRLFMPADSPHINLCKTIMSAVAMGYPMPILLNWNREYNRPAWHFAGSHIAKLESLLGAIETLLESKSDDVGEDDVAVLVDAYDMWFQLPPSVLLERYHRLNSEADARIRKQWKDLGIGTDSPISPPRQDIIVTTAKDCFPDSYSGSDPHYEHWPESPMPKDMYGEDTDKVPWSFDPARKYKKVRPRCVNSGLIMGSMGGLRDALKRSKEKIDTVAMKGRQLWSDQALIGEVIGDQEIWREWMRHLGSSWNGSAAFNDRNSLDRTVRDIADAALLGKRFEFGIGLDYNFTTAPPTCSSEEDGYFVNLSNETNIREESQKAGVPGDIRIHGIPSELRNIKDKLLSSTNWGTTPLYTDFFFGTIPIAIHHNAYINGLKGFRLKNWWHKMWYYPHLRHLITQRLQPTSSPPTLAEIDLNGDKIAYKSPQEDKLRKARVFSPKKPNFTPIDWDAVCQKPGHAVKWLDELFGDDKGPLAV
ncbi:hypothetical protein FOVG_00200 [Fusarium oxysporum f. sp. pisi HDV247]|uniref:Uncharacterized protein n=1 Tax=Fusarium oxysporum f. sp. pisi HDV247 TaxID=1080344 RepID=W9Q2A8_FUSOX|nr:hypothetical protein FOVG_00200 [Fusarium oxysporum f. sp. pisi HDV247]EXA51584.1 hypothetical protein FOVG_00200 [Fusarium oxysporum f. sp. pisi HDV247]